MLKKMLSSGKRKLAVLVSMMALCLSMASSALAAGIADTAVVTGITGIVDNVVATIVAIAPVCLGIFAAFVIWKYGKRIFTKLG